jgi:hypothetical protein
MLANYNKCVINFSSQYAFLHNNQHIHIDYYIINKDTMDPVYKNICCIKGHELICVNGKKNKAHFRHKNADDVGGNHMTEWHIEWQGNFPVTEIEFKKTCDKQIKSRRTDVLLSETHVIEFQHSLMTKEEVNNRINDYKLHNKTILWLIDGNKNIIVNDLSYSERVYLEFIADLWKFESYIDCEYIYIDINCKIYKIFPKLIKSNMIDVQKPITKEYFINCALNCKEMFTDITPLQCRLFIKQQGAGNGKTYGIIKMLETDEFAHYKYFIYVSKQHSAVYVIYSEFQQQIKNGNLSYIKLEEEPRLVNKKYIIQYYNLKTNKICQIIIGTVDSFMYAIGNKNNTEIDKFEGLVNSIIDDHIETTSCGTINYGGCRPKLYKETILVGDEEQDLKQHYAKAIIQIMRNRYIDVYIVGDKLQSISHEVNAFTYLLENEFPYINKIVYEFSNNCRRFDHPKLINFVNAMIPFKKYGLPEINKSSRNSSLLEDHNPLIIFDGKTIYANDDNESKINTEVEKIMMYYEKEVNEYQRLPEDFLIVTPFTQTNPLVDALQLAINIFWKNTDTDDNFRRYAIFHKSEDGSSINLNESINATRIVSIHSSKGDGRKVVFVIGLNEGGLCRFSGISDSLIYDSLFHVAITRMKEKLYIRLDGRSDDITNKIQKYLHDTGFENSNINPDIQIYNTIKFETIKDCCKTTDNFLLFKEKMFDLINLQNLDDDDNEKKLIDTSHHNIRFASILIHLFLQIIKNEKKSNNSDIKKQIIAVFNGIIEQGITECSSWKGYNLLLQDKCIPILKMSDKGRDYIKYFNIIISFTKNILNKIKLVINGENISDFCPMECIILYYMIEASNSGRYTKFHVSELYNIVDIYSKSYIQNSLQCDHINCLCDKCFTSDITLKINNSLETYICVHFEKMDKITNNYKIFCTLYPNISWLINHPIYFNGKTTDYDIYKHYQLIGYDNDVVIIAYIKPQFNALNYNQILMDAVFDTYLVKNVKQTKNNDNDNYKRFFGKQIICIVFTTDFDDPYYIDLTNAILEQNQITIQCIIKEHVSSKYFIESKAVYNFYKFWRKNCPLEITRPLDIIDYIIQQFNLNKAKNTGATKQLPNYITEFFNNIKFKIENCDDKIQQKMVLKDYDNKQKFMEYLDQRINDSINRYFGFHICNEYVSDDDTGFISD